MATIRFFTDEDVHAAVAVALHRSGLDSVATPTVNRMAESDESQLQWATQEARVLVSFNVAHFAALHDQWMQAGRHHGGIVVSSQRPVGDTIRRLLHLANACSAEEMMDRLEFLGDW